MTPNETKATNALRQTLLDRPSQPVFVTTAAPLQTHPQNTLRGDAHHTVPCKEYTHIVAQRFMSRCSHGRLFATGFILTAGFCIWASLHYLTQELTIENNVLKQGSLIAIALSTSALISLVLCNGLLPLVCHRLCKIGVQTQTQNREDNIVDFNVIEGSDSFSQNDPDPFYAYYGDYD